jgi:penicillin-binding protein 1A
MALGAGSVTPMQMAMAYSVFANGGYRVNPWLVTRVTDHKANADRVHPPATARKRTRHRRTQRLCMIDSLLQEVTRPARRPEHKPPSSDPTSTARRAPPTMPGTPGSPDSNPVAAVTWIGYDTPPAGKSRNRRRPEPPVWISYMEKALKGVPVMEPTVPPGLVNVNEWYYEEYATPGSPASAGRRRSGLARPAGPGTRSDLFRN